MQLIDGQILYSAGDVVGFLECEHKTSLSLHDLLVERLPRAEDDESAKLIQDKGHEHEARYLESLEKQGLVVARIADEGTPAQRAERTLAAMRQGADIIYQGAFVSKPFYGLADFLRRVEEPSAPGDYGYEVLDTKLGRRPQAKFLIQLSLYSAMLEELQSRAPQMMGLILGDGEEHRFAYSSYSRYFRQVREQFLAFVGAETRTTSPERCDHCGFCQWRDRCADQWLREDHLNQVAGITRNQIERLRDAGITTMAQLGSLDPSTRVARLQPETVTKLTGQARLQASEKATGRKSLEILPADPDGHRGFFRLPEPDEGDLFFDMEGDPFEEGGLEYLFGARFLHCGKPAFRAFWAHDRREERIAFEQFMDFVQERMKRYPRMHIYHYAHYEPTALKRLMSQHGTRETVVDDLLRQGRFVDLYKVVRESMRTSAPAYSIKDIEKFYMEAREGEVTNAGASIVYYERWRETKDPAELAKIQSYNEDDCRSTELLREWLLKHRPAGLAWYTGPGAEHDAKAEEKSERMRQIEAAVERYRKALFDPLPPADTDWDAEDRFRALTYYLVDFHRRADKPQWWELFARQDAAEEELIEDIECLGGLRRIPGETPLVNGKSAVHAFSFPEQETKLRTGKKVHNAALAKALGEIVELDEESRVVRLKISGKKEVPDGLSIGPGGPVPSDKLRLAVWRFADSIIRGDSRYPAAEAFLRKLPPMLRGLDPGDPIAMEGDDIFAAATAAVLSLERSYLFIQGPPGAGKTTTGSHVILRLLQEGKRVGVTSNSHKAINNLLHAVEERAVEAGIQIRGLKKSNRDEPDSMLNGTMIVDVTDSKDVIGATERLVGGTAWLFAEPELEQAFDYLFVDEAGQVSLANLVAVSTAAKNIVLLGDQMQLGQPIQGVHPGRSGESTLEYLLDGAPTVPPDRGIFLGTSWRMHPDVCRFISDAVYDSRLAAAPGNERQTLVLDRSAHPALLATGIRFLPVAHDGCSQRSEPEALVVKDIYDSLMRQSYEDKQGARKSISSKDVLVVAPYNAQVNLLRHVLPDGARIGTIDKFQGQEAEVVIVSMATSNEEYLPRNIEFLYDKNRLNVAVSRAKCAAIVVASPDLLKVHCSTPQQMELVNTLCWLRDYSDMTNGRPTISMKAEERVDG
ncbi:MAG TPA: TM0106 family RecB-like putative nuclease [Usitatibacter sp.]|jgi:uncharacterized protein|nr:TM0106 family RecB-like putative nuclease [Usitatibacter sp.]